MMNQVPRTQLTAVNVRVVPMVVRDQFKAYCARRGYTMQQAIIALMKKATRDNMPLPEARGHGKARRFIAG